MKSATYWKDAVKNGGMWGTMMIISNRWWREKKPPRMTFFQYLEGRNGSFLVKCSAKCNARPL